MDNAEIANALTGIADLLEIRGENPFKVRAYRRAVRTVRGLTRPLSAMVEAGADLTTLPGIGREIARHIDELVRTGTAQRLADLEKEMPATLGDLMDLDGIGPKRARQLHEALGIRTVADLRDAIDRGAVAELPGFGAKTIAAMRQSLDRPRQPTRFRLADVEPLVQALLDWMRRAPGLDRIEAAGSYRRRVETVGDIDLLAICRDPSPVMDHFVAWEGVARIAARGGTRGSVILASGLQVDLRIVPPGSYGAALHYFTGSKAHNVAVRALGVSRGLRINEYGVFRVAGAPGGDPALPPNTPRTAGAAGTTSTEKERVGGETEEDVFREVGLAFVPPELREDRGEIDAARRNALPALITLPDIRGDLHMHSTWSDGGDDIRTMVRGCIERGYAYMAITDHSPAVAVARGLSPERLERQWLEIDEVRRAFPGIRILRGMEVDILGDGSLDLPDSHLAGLDLVIVSVHSAMRMPRDRMTERVLRAISHPHVDVLAHPTGRLINEREPYDIDVEAVLRAAAANDVAVELNARPHRLDLKDVHLQRSRELGVRVVIDTDAHGVRGLSYMAGGVDQARRGWLEPDDVVNAMPLEAFERWLQRRDGGR